MPNLQAHITIEFNTPVWKLIIDEPSQTLFVELRDIEKREVSFSAVSLKTGLLNFNKLTVDEKWLTGLDAAHDEVAYLHGYQNDSGPVHQGIVAIDAGSGKILWANYAYTLNHIGANGPVIYAANQLPRRLVAADSKTGKILRPYQPGIDMPVAPTFSFPTGLPSLPLALRPFIERDITGNVQYHDYNDFRIVSLHCINNGMLQQQLYVFNNVKLVYNDLLNDQLQKLQPEAFMLQNNHLIYVKNKSRLIILKL